VGGVVAELLSLRGHIELPHRVKPCKGAGRAALADRGYEVDLGIFSRVLLGAAAGLALLAIYTPSSPTALVVNALIAGSAATGIFKLLKGRMLGAQTAGGKGQAPTPKGQLSVMPDTRSSAA
jgi:hypothetical protein